MKKYFVRFCYPTYYETVVEAEDEDSAYALAQDNCFNATNDEWEIGEDEIDHTIYDENQYKEIYGDLL